MLGFAFLSSRNLQTYLRLPNIGSCQQTDCQQTCSVAINCYLLARTPQCIAGSAYACLCANVHVISAIRPLNCNCRTSLRKSLALPESSQRQGRQWPRLLMSRSRSRFLEALSSSYRHRHSLVPLERTRLQNGLSFRGVPHVFQHFGSGFFRLRLTKPGAVPGSGSQLGPPCRGGKVPKGGKYIGARVCAYEGRNQIGAQNLQSVLQEQLCELEVFVLQDLHKPGSPAHQSVFTAGNPPVLALLQVFDRKNLQDLLFSGDALVRVLNRNGGLR